MFSVFLVTVHHLYSTCFWGKVFLQCIFAPSTFLSSALTFLSRGQWCHPLWTHLCHYSLLLWWPHLHSRWVTSLWAVLERWESFAWDQECVQAYYLRITCIKVPIWTVKSIDREHGQYMTLFVFSLLCSSWLPTHLCKEHISHSMHTCRHHLFL